MNPYAESFIPESSKIQKQSWEIGDDFEPFVSTRGKKKKHDVSEWGETEYVACEVGKIRGTKEFSNQFASIKSKWGKSQ